MQTQTGWWCDTRNDELNFPGCEEFAAVAWFCVIEGKEIALCGTCNRTWRARAAVDKNLQNRCPHCASFVGVSGPAPVQSPLVPPLSGPLADAIDKAMFTEGLLVDVRKRVLRRLGANVAIAALSRQQIGGPT